VSPQLQTSPHWQPARRSAFGGWQPQLQLGPGQDLQVHAFELVAIESSLSVVDVMSTTRSFASAGAHVLDGTAVLVV
jgi:hypothetical protein